MSSLLNKAAVQSYMNGNVAGINEWCAAMAPLRGIIFSTGPSNAQTYLSRYNFTSGALLDYANINTLGANATFQGSMVCDPSARPWTGGGGGGFPAVSELLPAASWTLGSTWGTGNTPPTGPASNPLSLAWLQVGNAGYIVGGGFSATNVNPGDVWVLAAFPGNFNFAGHQYQNSGGSTTVCAGPQGPGSATAYWTVQPFSIFGTSFGLGSTTVTAIAAVWNVSSWPTPNPGISSTTIKASYAATDFGGGMSDTISSFSGPAYDHTDGNVIIFVSLSTGAAYVAKLSTANGAVLWKVSVANTNGFSDQSITQSVIANGYFYYLAPGGVFGPGTLYQIRTSTGSVATYSVFAANEGVTGLSNQVSNDVLGCIIGNAGWNNTGNFLVLLNSTPSSGSSLAAVYFFGAIPLPQGGGAISYTRTWGVWE